MVIYPKYKRPLDLSILLFAHITPPFPLIWVLIWTVIPLCIWLEDRGPVFYTQTRIGKNKKLFKIYKFRTMIVNAETSGPVWASKSDPRITKIGKLLRLTALDELPQILNIIKNDMSFIGPRAERPELHHEFSKVIPKFDKRLAIKPGLTGSAQIAGPYDLDPGEKLEYDLDYIHNISFKRDVYILLKSILNTVSAKWDKPDKENTI
jgi:Sugar transferases involved in lipopolysaccharide synthesis